jgi:outer membrane cobalamin receptor
VEFSEFTQPATDNITYANLSRGERGGDRFSSSLNYKHIFEKGGHEILADFDYQKSNGEEFTINEYFDQAGILSSGRKNTEDGPSERFNAKIDYSLPVNDNSKFESGLRASIGKSSDDSKSFIRDASNLEYLFQDQFSNIVDYKRNIYSLYSLFNSKFDKFGFQVGIRGEYTDRLITLTKTSEDSKIQRWDYFPTIHTSYSFSRLVQIMASYTRRIDRPRGYYFEPFITWEDQNNVRRGNPDLKPEYINSFEIAYLTHISETIFSIESYYRERKNKIERVRLIYDTNVTLRTAENVGTDHTLGVEFMLNSDIIENWNLNFMGDLSNYRLKGFFNGRNFDRENFNWSLRLNNSIALLNSLKFELNGRYNGPRISAQGEYATVSGL